MRVAIIEHVGGHGGMDYYDYGLAYGLGVNGLDVSYHTCNATKSRKFVGVDTFYTFGNLWNHSKVIRIGYLFWGYFVSFKKESKLKTPIVHLHLFNFTLQNVFILIFAKLFSFKIILTIHDVNSFYNLSKLQLRKKNS